MAAATLALGVQQTLTLGTAGNVQLVNLPTGRKMLRVRFRATPGKVLIPYTGADDAAIGGAGYADAYADADFIRDVSPYGTTIGLASATTSAVVEIEVSSL